MVWSMDDALNDPLIKVLSRDDDIGDYEIRVGQLKTIVRIQLRRFLTSDVTEFQVSHAIHTPTQIGPYWTSVPFEDDPPYALRRAIRGLTQYYEEAVREGHKPHEGWLTQGH